MARTRTTELPLPQPSPAPLVFTTVMDPLSMFDYLEDYIPPETLALKDIAPRSIDRVPMEIWHRVFDFLPTSQAAITATVSKDFLEASRTWDRWIDICSLNRLKWSRRIYKSEMTLVCSESYFICDLCDRRTTGEGHSTACQVPITVVNKADSEHIWRLCANCRNAYYKAFPDDESSLQGIALDVMVPSDWIQTHLLVDLVDFKAQKSEDEAIAENSGPIGYRPADGSTVFKFWDMVERTKAIHGGWVGFAAAKAGVASTLQFTLELRKARDETLALLRRRNRKWLQEGSNSLEETIDILTCSGDEDEEDMETLFSFGDEAMEAVPCTEAEALETLPGIENDPGQAILSAENKGVKIYSNAENKAIEILLDSEDAEIGSEDRTWNRMEGKKFTSSHRTK